MKFLRSFPVGILLLVAGGLLLSGCSEQRRLQAELDAGMLALQAKQFEKAKISFFNALRIQSTNHLAIQQLGKIYFAQGQIAQAGPFLAAGRGLAPDDLQIREHLLTIFGSSNTRSNTEVKRLLFEIDDLLRIQPTNEIALLVLGDVPTKLEETGLITQRLEALRQRHGDQAVYRLPEARVFLLAGNLPQAEATLRKAVALSPQLPSAHLQLGKVLVGSRRVEEGEAQLKLASELAPPEGAPREFYARYLLQTRRPGEAYAIAKTITTEAPEHLPGWILRAEVGIATGEFTDARESLARALRQVPDSLPALSTLSRLLLAENKTTEAIRVLEQLVSARPDSSEIRFQMAIAHLSNKDINRAVGELGQAMRIDPRMANAKLLLSDLKVRQGDYDAAIPLLKSYLEEYPKSEQAWQMLIRAQQASQRLNDALQSAESLRKALPNNPAGALQLGFILRQQTNNAAARRAFDEALRLDPRQLVASEQLVLMDLEARDFESATRRAQAEIDATPTNALPWLIKSQIHRVRNETNQELAALQQAVRLSPDSELGLRKLAEAYITRGSIDEAIASLEKIAAADASDPRPWAVMGILHSERKDPAKARAAYERALALDPNQTVVLNNLAYLLSDHFGLLDDGYRLGLRARERAPADGTIADTLGWIEFRRGQYHEALRLIREGLQRVREMPGPKRDTSEIEYHLGMAYYMMGDEANARTSLSGALARGTDFAGKASGAAYLAALNAVPDPTPAVAIKTLAKRRDEVPTDVINLLRLGRAQQAAGEPDNARNSFEAALKISPRSPFIQAHLARLYATSLQQPARAQELIRSARDYAPENAELGRELGQIALAAGDPVWAYPVLEEASRQLPGRPDFTFDRAWAAFGVGRIEEARTHMKTLATSTSPYTEPAKRFLANTAFIVQPTATIPTTAELQSQLKANPADPAAWYALATQLSREAKPSEARAALERLRAAAPTFPPAIRQLALIYAEQSPDDPKAYEFATLAREANSADDQVAAALGKIVCRRGEYAFAERLLSEAARTQGKDPSLHYHLGLAYRGTQQKAAGVKAFEKALELAPTAPFAAEAKRYLEELKKG